MNICMKSLDENTFYLFALGTLYILVNIFRSVDKSVLELSKKISEMDTYDFPEMEDKETQTEDHDIEPIIIESPKKETKSRLFSW